MVITARGARAFGARIGELWGYREMAIAMARRDLSVRYAQTALGASWAVIQPLVLMVVFSLFLGRAGGLRPDGVPYAVYSFAALVPWMLFSGTVAAASNSLVQNGALVQKVYFPRLLLPISTVGVFLVDFVMALAVLLIMAVVLQVQLTGSLLVLPVLAALTAFAALSIGIGLAGLNARFRDVKHAVPFMLQAGLLASPVAYGFVAVPAEWRMVYALNPLAGIIETFRWAFFGGPPPTSYLLVSVAAATVLFCISVAYFMHVESTLADIV